MSLVRYICTCSRAHPFPHLRNYCTYWVEIWRVINDPSAMRFTNVIGWGTSARAHVHILFQHLWNDLMDCAEIWFVVIDPASGNFAEAKSRMHL